ncbi:MAG TPA: hypothetical protein VHJ99_06065 [Candidatus Dormibacteraeota bacterium]|nr:hypothetical protein [Candidatus Dormibacteraeota bacterium]
MKPPRGWLAALDGLVLAVVVILFGVATGAFTGTVRGYDGWGHLTKVLLVLRDFPAVDWNYDWYSGSPFFLGGYPPLFYFAASALAGMGMDAMVAMNLLIALSYLAMTVSLYALVRIATGSRLAGIVASGLLIATPGVWTPFVQAGLYTRVFGMGFTSLAFLLASLYLRRPTAARYAICLAAVFGALNSHVVLGAVAILAVGLVLVLVPGDDGHTRKWRVALLAPPVLLSAYYYLPLALYPLSGSQVTDEHPTLGLGSLVAPLFPLLPIAVLSLVGWLRLRSRQIGATANRLMLVCGLLSAVLLLYALIPLPRPVGLRSEDMLFLLSWFLAALTGLALGSIKVPAIAWQRNSAAFVVVAATLMSILAVIPFVTQTIVRDPARPEAATAGWQPINPTETNFRVASPSDNLSVWLNAVYDVPQTRGYAATPQIRNPDWQFWLDSTAWSGDASEGQRSFLFDWYAVRWVYVPSLYMPSTAGVVPKLTGHPDLYMAVPSTDGGPSLTFSYLRSTPIAVASNAPVILVIGAPDNYQLVFRDLSYSAFDTRHAIPVQGSPYVDDYSAQDLAKFDEVVIYGGRAHDSAHAFDLLKAYVSSGGGLIIDSRGSPLADGSGISEPLPITGATSRAVSGDFRFKAASSPLTDGIDFSSFGPARYGGGPWMLSAATGVRSWAHTVLWSGDDSVVVAGQFGQGRVVWSGLNLPYHIDSYRSAEESRFLTTAMTWASRSRNDVAATASARRDGPQQMTVSVDSPARGVLFKESWFDRWHAYVNGREVEVLRAGPGFMYILLPESARFPAEVQWRYEKSVADWAGIAVSAATLIALVTWPRWRSSVRRRLGGWWDRRIKARDSDDG